MRQLESISDKVGLFFAEQPVKKAFVFGSVARNEASTESDIDFLLDMEASADIFQLANIKLSLESIFCKNVDVITTRGISPRLKPSIEKDIVLIYEKK